jgi:hypothetical protein
MIKLLFVLSVFAFAYIGVLVLGENGAIAAGPCNSSAQNCP